MGLDALLNLHNTYPLNASVLKTQHSESKLSLVLSNRHTFPALPLSWHGGNRRTSETKRPGQQERRKETQKGIPQ